MWKQSLSKYEQALRYEIFIKQEYGCLNKIIKEANEILDIGWHFGFFTEYCYKLQKDKNSLIIHFFEPVELFFKIAKTNLEKDSKNIFFNNLWVWYENTVKDIFINQEKSMQSSLYVNTFLNKKGVNQKAKFIRIDDYCRDKKIEKIDLLKLDVEGAEFVIIENLESNFWGKIKNLFIEYHLLNKELENKFKKIILILKSEFKRVTIIESKYSTKIGYIFCF